MTRQLLQLLFHSPWTCSLDTANTSLEILILPRCPDSQAKRATADIRRSCIGCNTQGRLQVDFSADRFAAFWRSARELGQARQAPALLFLTGYDGEQTATDGWWIAHSTVQSCMGDELLTFCPMSPRIRTIRAPSHRMICLDEGRKGQGRYRKQEM